MPKSTLDSYGTWALPYLRPPDVPGASRCLLTFASQEVLDTKDFYRGKKRYRFNKWRPISPQFPRLHSTGLIFSAHQDDNLTGVISPWTFPKTGTGEVKFALLPTVINEFDAANDFYEIGIGFSRYSSKYWGLAQGCEYICKLTAVQPGGLVRSYSTLNNTVIPPNQSFNQDSGVIFTLRHSPANLEIVYEEFDPATSAVTYGQATTFPNPGIPANQPGYRVLFYICATSRKGTASISKTLLSTDIRVPGLTLDTSERVWFLENPATFVPPFAPLRDTGLSMYAKPYRALIEDADILVGSPFTPPIWMRTLDFVTTGSMEPAVFTDPDGYEWLVSFRALNASSSMEVGDNGMGYELTMPVLVVH